MGCSRLVDQPSGGAQRSIPPGRYTVTVSPGRQMGSWVRCNNILCGIQYQDDVLAIENATSPDYSSVMEIEPTDAAIWLQGLPDQGSVTPEAIDRFDPLSSGP